MTAVTGPLVFVPERTCANQILSERTTPKAGMACPRGELPSPSDPGAVRCARYRNRFLRARHFGASGTCGSLHVAPIGGGTVESVRYPGDHDPAVNRG